ncbi:DUF1492 domain-containing protein [Paenibacillus lentus]|uniref:DUF1492 domain-containing protein n=1 Tax=Paenibacillus lentus TaxID=1338368 RepID=UPI00365CD25D
MSTVATVSAEQKVIKELTEYRDDMDRIRVLQTYPVGGGITVSRLNEDDQLQDLHRQLRRLPTYMYLNGHEQKLEKTATAYLIRHPAGTKAQKRAVEECVTVDDEDKRHLEEVIQKIEKVVKARTGRRGDIEKVLDQLAEYQDLISKSARIDSVLLVLKRRHPHFEKLIRLRYIEKKEVTDICEALGVVEKTYFRWRIKAVEEYAKLAGF